ncbi:MAG: response regulator transcription factor, partial [Pyrinomonadaceae bacterium]|nr:response regulator transcription factor [Pyrinomonadaceae bacterium]
QHVLMVYSRSVNNTERSPMSRVRVLLADDHSAMLDRIVEWLSREYEVVGAVCDGQTLLEAAAATNPDVIVSDVSMPIVNGIEAAQQLRKRGSKAKIIFLSVHEDPDYISASLEAGAIGYVIKPRVTSDLCLAIKRAMKGRRFVSPASRLEKVK